MVTLVTKGERPYMGLLARLKHLQIEVNDCGWAERISGFKEACLSDFRKADLRIRIGLLYKDSQDMLLKLSRPLHHPETPMSLEGIGVRGV